jgi:hypothetical protein
LKPDDVSEVQSQLGTVGEYLFRALFSSLGRSLDEIQSKEKSQTKPTVQSLGVYRIYSPQKPLIQAITRKLCQTVAESWTSKESSALVDSVAQWLQERFQRDVYGAETLISRLQEGCAGALGMSPESRFAEVVSPIVNRNTKEINLELAAEVLAQLQEILGNPGEETIASRFVLLEETLVQIANTVANEWSQSLSELIVRLIEEPGYRLAAAEEAIRQITATINQTIQTHESLLKEMENRSLNSFTIICDILRGLASNSFPSNRVPIVTAEITELMEKFPRWRYQALLLRQINRAFTQLSGSLAEILKDVQSCRSRLAELAKAFEKPAATGSSTNLKPARLLECPGKRLYSSGCHNVEDFGHTYVRELSPESMDELDSRVQSMIRRQFRALTHICLGTANLIKALEPAMLAEAESFVASMPPADNVTEIFLSQFQGHDEALGELTTALDESAAEIPQKIVPQHQQSVVLLAPASAGGKRVQELAKEAMPDLDMHFVEGSDDILIYRAVSSIPIAELVEADSQALANYKAMLTDVISPHARLDLPFPAWS